MNCRLILRGVCLLILGGLGWEAAAQDYLADYDTLTKIEEKIQKLAKDNKGFISADRLFDGNGKLVETDQVDKANEDENIVQPRNVWVLEAAKASKVPAKDRVRILVTGCQHGGEWVSYVVVLRSVEFIVQNQNKADWPADRRFDYLRKFKDLNVKNLAESSTLVIIPVANPAGFQYSRLEVKQDKLDPDVLVWRKNRRDVSNDPKDVSEKVVPPKEFLIGVDLNRNFPSKNPAWGTITLNSKTKDETTSRKRGEEVYCGRPKSGDWTKAPLNPLMENETRGIHDLVALKGKTYSGYIDVHSYTGLVGSVQSPDNKAANLRPKSSLDDKTVFDLLEKQAASMIIDAVDLQPYRPGSPYPASGTTREWVYEQTGKKAPAFLIEVGNKSMQKQDAGKWGYRPPAPQRHADAVLPGMLFLMFAMVDKEFSNKPFADFKKP
jgi:hypothetical protein